MCRIFSPCIVYKSKGRFRQYLAATYVRAYLCSRKELTKYWYRMAPLPIKLREYYILYAIETFHLYFQPAFLVHASFRECPELSMELWHDHVIPLHVLRCRAHQLQVKSSHNVRNCHIHFHVRQTIPKMSVTISRGKDYTYLIPKHERLPREKGTRNLALFAVISGPCNHRSGSNSCGFSKRSSL